MIYFKLKYAVVHPKTQPAFVSGGQDLQVVLTPVDRQNMFSLQKCRDELLWLAYRLEQ